MPIVLWQSIVINYIYIVMIVYGSKSKLIRLDVEVVILIFIS